MNEFEYTPNEILRLQTATQIVPALISRTNTVTDECMKAIVRDAVIIANLLLEEVKTPLDRRIRIPEGSSIFLEGDSFYYEYKNQDGDLIRTKLGE